jgi:hypothetical protein
MLGIVDKASISESEVDDEEEDAEAREEANLVADRYWRSACLMD